MADMINLTPHEIILRDPSGRDHVVPPSGTVARVASVPGTEVAVEGLPVPVYGSPVWGEVEGLPAPEAGVVFLVSALVAGQCRGRSDVVSPGTGPNDGAVRNEAGHVVAVTRLIQAPA